MRIDIAIIVTTQNLKPTQRSSLVLCKNCHLNAVSGCYKITLVYLPHFTNSCPLSPPQAEIVKRLNAICAQVIPFLSQEVRELVCVQWSQTVG